MLVRAFRLRDFILVMRELQILTTAVNVEMFAEQVARHGRAFDMPARPPLAPRRIPFDFHRLAGLGSFPQDKVERIAFAAVDIDPFAGAQIVERLAGQLAVTGKIAHRVIDVAVGALIGQAIVFELADQSSICGT